MTENYNSKKGRKGKDEIRCIYFTVFWRMGQDTQNFLRSLYDLLWIPWLSWGGVQRQAWIYVMDLARSEGEQGKLDERI